MAREPLLTTGRVDLMISTFTYTADRDTRIDFSRPYYKATGRLLVKTDSPIATLNDIRGKRIATTSGSTYDRWMKRCFTDTTVVVLDSVTNAVIAFNQGRADAVMWDDSALATLAARRPVVEAHRGPVPRRTVRNRHQAGQRPTQAMGGRAPQPHEEEDLFAPIIRNNIAPRFLPAFLPNVLRPNSDFAYRAANLPSIDTVCP